MYAFSADIHKMFRLIQIDPGQSYLQRFLWKNNIDDPIRIYNLQTVMVLLWSDSTVALAWIRSPPHLLKTFVSNRVAQI